MKKKTSAITIGIDLGDRKHSVCVLDAKGEVVKQESITNTRASLTALSRRYPAALMVMEVARVREQENDVPPFPQSWKHRINTCTAPSNATEPSPAGVRMEAQLGTRE